jgi:hypothetical protein
MRLSGEGQLAQVVSAPQPLALALMAEADEWFDLEQAILAS